MAAAASSSSHQWSLVQLLIAVLSLSIPKAILGSCSYTSIFSFGDSLTDTGNLHFLSTHQRPDCFRPPYGSTHFHHPNGRCSDGRLILDFIGTKPNPSTHQFCIQFQSLCFLVLLILGFYQLSRCVFRL